MSHSIDYLLYDNRSRASWGRDWGLKAATGRLAKSPEVQREFVDYCKLSFETGRNRLADFEWALGGFRTPDRRGYVVCVTVEVEDRAGRPTVAVLGLHPGDPGAFQWCLTQVDLPATARGILEHDEPPSAWSPRLRAETNGGSSELVQTLRRYGHVDFLLDAFEPEKSVAAVLGYYLHSAGNLRKPPCDILGVTSLIRPQELRGTRYQVVYCRPAPGNRIAQETLARYLEEQQKRFDQTLARPAPSALPSPATVPARPFPGGYSRARGNNRSLIFGALLAVVVAMLLGVGLVWLDRSTPRAAASLPERTETPPDEAADPGSGSGAGETSPAADAAIVPEPSRPAPPVSRTDEEFLSRIEAAIRRFEDLDPGELTRHRVHGILTEVEVAPDYRDQRESLLRDLKVHLPGIREKFLGLNLAYYFNERGKDFPIADRATAIRSALATAEIGDAGCQNLKFAFGFAFRSESRPLHEWCEARRAFEALIRESRVAR